MEENLKQLLLKDLCARLPYGVICHYETVVPLVGEVLNYGPLQEIRRKGEYFIVNGATCLYEDIKPYLRPMSSMTEEEREEMVKLHIDDRITSNIEICDANCVDFYNSHHLDYRGLIPMGLALEAPEDMYKIE